MEKVTKAETKRNDANLTNAITSTLQLEQNFKLFSYRIVDQKTFIAEVENIAKTYIARATKIEKEFTSSKHQNQMDIEDAILEIAKK